MDWAPKEHGVYKHRVFPDVYPKGFRTPAADCLNCCKICTSFCKRSGAARSHRLTGDLVGEKGTKSTYKPVTCRNTARGCEPKFGVDGKQFVS